MAAIATGIDDTSWTELFLDFGAWVQKLLCGLGLRHLSRGGGVQVQRQLQLQMQSGQSGPSFPVFFAG